MTSSIVNVVENLFYVKPLITNFRCKLSTITAYDPIKQILCLISEDNQIFLRYTNNQDVRNCKNVTWFKEAEKVIHDVCFDPTGAWLLVLCFDNTLHIVPALKLLDPTQPINNIAFSISEITSFVIPFVGPHECPNSITCPNSNSSNSNSPSPIRFTDSSTYTNLRQTTTNEINESYTEDQQEQPSTTTKINEISQIAVPLINDNSDIGHIPYSILKSDAFGSTNTNTETTASSSRKNSRKLKEIKSTLFTNRTTSSSNESTESFLSACTCPYPICVTWWQTTDKRNRAVIGYSDGSICFVGLTPNCPFIGNTSIDNGFVRKLMICRDNNDENVTLLINSSAKEQWKLLLEQKSIKYMFPTDLSPSTSQNSDNKSSDDWTFIMQIQSSNNMTANDPNGKIDSKCDENGKMPSDILSPLSNQTNPVPISLVSNENTSVGKGILPAAKARFSLLKNLGTKKLNAFKMKLSDAKSRLDGYISEESLNSFAMIDSPTTTPEILTTSSGPYYSAQNLRNTLLLSALHSYSDILSIHRMDLKLIPLFHYKIPKYCQEIMIGSNILYSIQLVKSEQEMGKEEVSESADEDAIEIKDNSEGHSDEDHRAESEQEQEQEKEKEREKDTKPNTNDEMKLVNAVGVISSAMASIKNGDVSQFNQRALLGLFPFPDKTIINIHRMAPYETAPKRSISNDNDNGQIKLDDIKTPSNYIRLHRSLNVDDDFSRRDFLIMEKEFPKINYDPCIVVTNKATYFIELHKEPHTYFLNAVIAGKWDLCEEFCTTFDLSFAQCVEFAGDCLLRKKRVTEALYTYNIARIPTVRTALKLAMYGENYALMQLCAMALKSSYILKSRFVASNLIKHLLLDCNRRHCDDILSILPNNMQSNNENINEGKSCSDYSYVANESSGSLQMSTSSQFHLSNLLLITLTERAVKDKIYNLAVWNFIVTNTKFHTNMTSIVLCQSGLYMAALLLALVRGCCIDVFVGFVNVSHQEFGWYSEINVLFYNLSEKLFCECITYLRHVSADYFDVIQKKLKKLDQTVLQRLEAQLNPFMAVFRPIVSHRYLTSPVDENDSELLEFSKLLVETYLAIIMQIDAMKMKSSNILNALNTHRIVFEDNQFAIKSSNFSPISVGYSHCSCVIDGCAYFWGSNGIPCVYNVGKPIDPPEPAHVVKCLEILASLNLEVHAVKCGRQHSLILTNNGLYAFGSNNFGQLGINKKMQAALQPMLVESLDGKDITLLEAGQYHNAVVIDGKLYTWGWGAYGQLGHGDVENVSEPKLVKFFKEKVTQISLGHSHSLVLCTLPYGNSELYVFGSNHFGQLGITQQQCQLPKIMNEKTSPCSSFYPIKSLVPIRIDVSNANIRLIHTKFFCNFVVDENNELYTWGLSPQALRLTNQVKRRANAKQKIEESLKKVMKNRTDNEVEEKESECIEVSIPIPNKTEVKNLIQKLSTMETSVNSNQLMENVSAIENKENEFQTEKNEIDGRIPMDQERHSGSDSIEELPKSFDMEVLKTNLPNVEKNDISNDITDQEAITNETKINDSVSNLTKDGRDDEKCNRTPKLDEADKKLPNITADNESSEHMTPQKVDTSEVSGQILQVSSGLLHFALISSTSMLFTWGKNLEHQLGTEDKERKPVNKPTPLESIENPLYVECGADFTIVMTRDYCVKAFGGNANGQCGRDLTPISDKAKSVKLFCLPTTKRLMRLEGNCVESPIDIPLPRPRIRMDSEPIRYMKCIPKFRKSFVIKPSISFGVDSSKSGPSGTSGISDDVVSSIENISFLDEDSCSALTGFRNLSSNDISPDDGDNCGAIFQNNFNNNYYSTNGTYINEFRNYIHYCLYIFHGLYEPEEILAFSNNNLEFRIRMLMLNFKYVDAFVQCLIECHNAQQSIRIFEFFTKDPSIVPMRRKDLKFFIYHLFIHFISKNFDITECEKFFLCNLDFYLQDLSYVMYFNNNNTELEQTLNQKFKTYFVNDFDDMHECKLENTDVIFETLSIKFKAIVCQRLLQAYKS